LRAGKKRFHRIIEEP